MYIWKLLATLLECFVFCRSQAVFNRGLLTWDEARSNCTLLGPSVQGSLQTANISSMGISDKAWIGAYRGLTPWLNVRGCYAVNTADLLLLNRTHLHEADVVGRCVESCPHTTIYGLSEKYCFCVSRLPNLSTKRVAKLCNGSTEDFCGGVLTLGNGATTDIMFYEKNNQLLSFVPGDLQCIQSQQSRVGDGDDNDDLVTTYTSRPSRCDDQVASYVCLNSAGSSSTFYAVTPRANWTQAVMACSTINQRIADNYNFNSVLHASRLILFWVGIFRREFTKIDTVIPYNPHISTLCTAARVNSDGTLLLFSESCNQKLPSWCEVQQTTTQTNTRGPRIITRPVPPDNNHLVAIYLPLGMFALLVVIVTVTIFSLRKRIAQEVRKTWIQTKNYTKHKECLTVNTVSKQNQRTESLYDHVNRSLPELQGKDHHEYDHANFKQTTQERTGYASIHIEGSGQNTSTRADSTYDHINRQNPTPSSSVYDRSDYKQNISPNDVTGASEDTAYDHLDRRAKKTKEGNFIYDHMGK